MTDNEVRLRILIIDDDQSIRSMMSEMLADNGFEVITAPDATEGLQRVRGNDLNLVILDYQLPDMDGLKVLAKIRELNPAIPVIMMSGYATIKLAVEATKQGAYDFIEKPPDADRVTLAIRNAIEKDRLRREVTAFRTEAESRHRMVGDSSALQQVRFLIGRVAPTSANVLITGESGTGKELVARALHLQSRRSAAQFVALNCAAIPHELIESELFGHEKGAFTGATAGRKGKIEEADDGTLFLDEIGDLSLPAQAKLLRVLEESEFQRVGSNRPTKVNVRLVAATNKDLAAGCKAGAFREDLYHRLNVVAIRIPPLRERKEDVGPLVQFFLDRFCTEQNRSLKLTPKSIGVFESRDWPGNVRELRNAVERIVVLAQANPVDHDEVTDLIGDGVSGHVDGTLKAALEVAEREAVRKALAETSGNVTAASRVLGVERPSLHRIMKRHGLESGPPDTTN